MFNGPSKNGPQSTEKMDLTDDLDFDSWFDIFHDKVNNLGYKGPIDKYTFEADYFDGVTPEAAAEDFVTEMNDSDSHLKGINE